MIFKPFLDVCFISGLVHLVHKEKDCPIEPIKPGSYEVYDLLPTGKASFNRRAQFSEVGIPPVYKTMIPNYGNV